MASNLSAPLIVKTSSANMQISPAVPGNFTKTYEDIFESEYKITQSMQLKYHDTRHDYTLEGHENWVSSIAISPDLKYAVSGSTDHTMKI